MKVCVLGAGASGLMAAITARRNNNDVTILNNANKPGKKKPGKGGGGSSKKPKDPVDETPTLPVENPTEELPIETEPIIEEPSIDEYEEPIIEEPTIDEYDIDIDIPTEPEPTKKNNGIKTMGIAAGIGLAVGASALGAHTIIKSREDDDEDADYGYEK